MSRPIRILSRPNLRQTWDASRDKTKKAGARGTDDQTARAFARNLDANIEKLHLDIAKGTFGFSKLRPVKVPKSNGKYRLVCVPTVRDRLVQRTIASYLNQSNKLPSYPASVFGFVPNGGVQKAVKQVCKFRSQYSWVYETDIESFFDSIEREKLFSDLQRILRRSSLLPLFKKLISTDISDKYNIALADFNLSKGRGLRQGMPLSPLLSNIALRDFDRALTKANIPAVRYVDDLVCFANSKEEAENLHLTIRGLLAAQGLSIPNIEDNTKTHIRHEQQSVEFLGWSIRHHQQSDSYRPYVSKEKLGAIRNRLVDYSDVAEQIKKQRDLTSTLRSLAESANAYKNTYKQAENKASVISSIEQTVEETKRQILIQLFGESAVSQLNKEQLSYIGLEASSSEAEF